MDTRIVEVTNGFNWGKFLIGGMDDRERSTPSVVDGSSDRPLLEQIGWNPDQRWVLDLQTCEGAAFLPGGSAAADLTKHRIWVCPMFEPFLEWLYDNWDAPCDLGSLPSVIELSDAPSAMAGYRRPGPNA